MEVLQNLFGVILPAFGYISAIFSYLYYNKIRFFILINKIFKRKKDANFSIIFDFNGEFEDLKILKDYFRKELSHEFKNISSSRNKETFQVDNLIITIEKSEFPEDEFRNRILVKNSNSSYLIASKNLNFLHGIFKKIKEKNRLNDVRYSFESNFNKTNPFLNTSVTKVGVDKIKHFFMIISTSTFSKLIEDEEDIQINMNKASYVTDDFGELKEVARIILAM